MPSTLQAAGYTVMSKIKIVSFFMELSSGVGGSQNTVSNQTV